MIDNLTGLRVGDLLIDKHKIVEIVHITKKYVFTLKVIKIIAHSGYKINSIFKISNMNLCLFYNKLTSLEKLKYL